MTPFERNLISIQQQLQQLNHELTSLLVLAATSRPETTESSLPRNGPAFPKKHTTPSTIGINRFRQFQANE